MAAWNCNGSYKIDVGAFEDSFKGRDMVFYSETHQRPGQPMPSVKGYYHAINTTDEVLMNVK